MIVAVELKLAARDQLIQSLFRLIGGQAEPLRDTFGGEVDATFVVDHPMNRFAKRAFFHALCSIAGESRPNLYANSRPMLAHSGGARAPLECKRITVEVKPRRRRFNDEMPARCATVRRPCIAGSRRRVASPRRLRQAVSRSKHSPSALWSCKIALPAASGDFYFFDAQTIEPLMSELEPNVDDANEGPPEDRNRILTYIEVGIVVGVLGILALLIAPAMMKKIKERKSAEASENVRVIYNLAVDHYMEQVEADGGSFANATFPPSTDPHPPEVGKRAVTTSDWHLNPTFSELGFSLDEPHYYQYAFTSDGVGENATFSVTARGDLDGDGEMSRFVMEGYIDNGEVRGRTITVDRLE